MTKYAWIINRNTKKLIKWQPYPYLLDTIRLLQQFNDLIFLKARQIGWSWAIGGGYVLHSLYFSDAAKVLMMSQNETDALVLLDKPKTIHLNLPDFLRKQLLHPESPERLDFVTSASIANVLPSKARSGRGTDASIVIRDELAEHIYGEENFTSIGPTVDGGGKLIDISTIKKKDASNHFTERIERAKIGARRFDLPSGLTVLTGGESGATIVFGGRELRRDRKEGNTFEEWWEETKKKYTVAQIEEQYPATIEDALKITASEMYFDTKALEDMHNHGYDPMSEESVSALGLIPFDGLMVWKPYNTGETYCMFTDVSSGVDDPFHTVVMHASTGEGVCEASAFVPVEKVAEIHDMLARYYHAWNWNETNSTPGGACDERLRATHHTPYRLHRRTPDGKIDEKHLGWVTSPSTKRTMLAALESAIRNRDITIHRRETILQMQTMMRVINDDTGKEEIPMVPKKKHDDAIMAWAGCRMAQKYTPKHVVEISSFQYGVSFGR